MRKIVAKVNDSLINCLRSVGISKNKTKTLVRLENILVNNKIIKKLPYDVEKGDVVVIKDNKIFSSNIDIVYEDNNYLVVNKENGLLTISTSRNKRTVEDTLYKRVRYYLNCKKEYAFIVNRIDKETSGLVIFVKNEELKNKLQKNWNKIVKSRRYMAVVTGKLAKNGQIDNYLYEDKLTFSHSTTHGGKRAITNYISKATNCKYSLLDINIQTGRKNQIRVHMSEMGHPIVGDKKYYSKDNRFKRLMLHHYEISFIDPLSHKLLAFKSEIPDEFYELFRIR